MVEITRSKSPSSTDRDTEAAQPLTQEVVHNGGIISLALNKIPYSSKRVIVVSAALLGTAVLAYLTNPAVKFNIDPTYNPDNRPDDTLLRFGRAAT